MDVTAEVEITKVKQLANSSNGITRWRVFWGRPGEWIGNAVTKTDAQFVQAIVWDRVVPGSRWMVTLNGRNQITNMVKA